MTLPRSRPFAQVDVFSSTPYLGNPVAVVLDGAEPDDQAMRRVARWTNLSETTFVLPPSVPEADYRLRIFTPGGELPFAGHPTLGSAHAWLEHGGTPPAMETASCRSARPGLWRCAAARASCPSRPRPPGAPVSWRRSTWSRS
ncbi:PhzF family phenazine biosynthesis protein [Streptomyces sporangiiformans]|uniref:PhzF family phenazine biosynthesis protein n=1 Tax=Streptomyces sporangiiformans TaxID=2315329 RepID=UPI0023E22395|nr:PhzF family phenazine biosynthesis isomerase [Streptomyces sporangiiformans]